MPQLPLLEELEGSEIGFDEEDVSDKDFPADPYDDYDSYYDETEGSESAEDSYDDYDDSEEEEQEEYVEKAPLKQFKGKGSYHEWRAKKEEQE